MAPPPQRPFRCRRRSREATAGGSLSSARRGLVADKRRPESGGYERSRLWCVCYIPIIWMIQTQKSKYKNKIPTMCTPCTTSLPILPTPHLALRGERVRSSEAACLSYNRSLSGLCSCTAQATTVRIAKSALSRLGLSDHATTMSFASAGGSRTSHRRTTRGAERCGAARRLRASVR